MAKRILLASLLIGGMRKTPRIIWLFPAIDRHIFGRSSTAKDRNTVMDIVKSIF